MEERREKVSTASRKGKGAKNGRGSRPPNELVHTVAPVPSDSPKEPFSLPTNLSLFRPKFHVLRAIHFALSFSHLQFASHIQST
jgi:hypothetical protein